MRPRASVQRRSRYSPNICETRGLRFIPGSIIRAYNYHLTNLLARRVSFFMVTTGESRFGEKINVSSR